LYSGKATHVRYSKQTFIRQISDTGYFSLARFFEKVLYHLLKHHTMRSILYIIAVILVIGWAVGVFAYSAGGIIYALLIIAIIAFVLGLLRSPTSTI
jgi:hypothetical protein